jgi:hypothetical protein
MINMDGQNSDVIMRKIMMQGTPSTPEQASADPAVKKGDCFDNGRLQKNQLYSENLQLGVRGVLINTHFSITQTPQLFSHLASLASGECHCALIVLKEFLQLALH